MGRTREDLKQVHYFYVALMLSVATVLWGLATTYNHHLEGVAVYSVAGSLPMKSVSSILSKTLDGNRENNVFIAENKLLPVCVFPDVYNAFDGKTTAEIKTILTTRGMTETEADAQVPLWTKINFQGWGNPYQLTEKPIDKEVDYNVPYNLPYDGLAAGKHLNPQYFSPVCRCMNTVFNTYKGNKGTYDQTVDALKACLATQHHIKTLELRGNQDTANEDLTQRKTISRHGLVFNLCVAIFFSLAYNSINFATDANASYYSFFGQNIMSFVALILTFLVLFLSQIFSFHCVSPANAMEFSTIVHVPAAVILLGVEYMWSIVAKESDTRRQSYLHPYSFYQLLVHLQLIALIENGVFTFHVLVSAVFTCNIVTLAYSAVLFIAHGKLYAPDTNNRRHTSEITGYILILVLVGLTYVFNMMPSYPVNSELNFLWLLPVIFTVFCFSQVVFLEHLLGEDEDEAAGSQTLPVKTNKTVHFTNSVHLLNMGHTFVVVAVLVYYAAQMHYTWHGDMSMANTGGLVDRRLNFELAELQDAVTTSYNTLQTGSVLRST